MAKDKNTVVVFWNDGTWDMQEWDQLALLEQHGKTFILVTIYHVQGFEPSPETPRATTFNSRDKFGLKNFPSGLEARHLRYNLDPTNRLVVTGIRRSKGEFFKRDSADQIRNTDLLLSDSVMAGMPLVLDGMDQEDPGFEDLRTRAKTMIEPLKTVEPGSGTY